MRKTTILYRKNLLVPQPSEGRKEAQDISDEEAEKMTDLYDKIGVGMKSPDTVKIEKEWIEDEWADMGSYKGKGEDSKVLNKMWKVFNNYEVNPLSAQNQPGEEEEQPELKEKNVDHTSMSIGDIVKVENTMYIACAMGWAEVEVVE